MNPPPPTHLGHDWPPADAPQRPALFISPSSGGGRAERARLDEAARERGIDPIVLEPGDDLGTLADEAAAGGADALGMAGEKRIARGSSCPSPPRTDSRSCAFPPGTRDHFARDLGVDPEDLVGALDAFTDALEGAVDLGDVNGRPFLNNISLGVYGAAVQRESYRDAKARTLFETAGEVLGPSAELPGVRLVDDLGVEHTDPAVILVSDNSYALGRPGADRAHRSSTAASSESSCSTGPAGHRVGRVAHGPRAPSK